MKSEEDEAFDELAKRQGDWGGGYQAKRKMAADKLQEPPSEWAGIKAILDEYGLQAIDFVADFKAAMAQPAQEPEREALKLALEALEQLDGIDTETECVTIDVGDVIDAIKEALAQPVQRTWIWLSDADIAEVVDTTCQYTGSYEEYLIKKAEQKSRSINNG